MVKQSQQPIHKHYYDGATTVARIRRLEELIGGIAKSINIGNTSQTSDTNDSQLNEMQMAKVQALAKRITEVEHAIGNLENAANDIVVDINIQAIPNDEILRILDGIISVHAPKITK